MGQIFRQNSQIPAKMSKSRIVNINEIDQWNSLSTKSQNQYSNAWDKFIQFLSNGAGTARPPTAEDYLTYFDFLKAVKNLKGVTIWSIYAKLNLIHYKTYGTKLSDFPHLMTTLKVKF